MKMTEADFDGAQPPIDAYAPDGFRVGGRFFDGPVILSRLGVAAWSDAASAAGDLDAAAAEALRGLEREADVVLIGAGREIAQPPAAFRAALDAAGIRYDVVGTPAACRTYNVLLTEDRRVAAALIPVGPN